jgi:hypothetical protein
VDVVSLLQVWKWTDFCRPVLSGSSSAHSGWAHNRACDFRRWFRGQLPPAKSHCSLSGTKKKESSASPTSEWGRSETNEYAAPKFSGDRS